jgi:hypothetical protein
MTSQFERDYTARQYRNVRKILRGNPTYCEEQHIPKSHLTVLIVGLLIGSGLVALAVRGSCLLIMLFHHAPKGVI